MLAGTAIGAELEPGDPAPAFELRSQHGETHWLGDYRGDRIVLYRHPRNDTPGCSAEACAFRDGIMELKSLNVRLLGVSMDDAESHARFGEKQGLPSPLLADTEGKTAPA